MEIFNHKFYVRKCICLFEKEKKQQSKTAAINEWKQMVNFIASDTKQRK